jgi:hypothetical protein
MHPTGANTLPSTGKDSSGMLSYPRHSSAGHEPSVGDVADPSPVLHAKAVMNSMAVDIVDEDVSGLSARTTASITNHEAPAESYLERIDLDAQMSVETVRDVLFRYLALESVFPRFPDTERGSSALCLLCPDPKLLASPDGAAKTTWKDSVLCKVLPKSSDPSSGDMPTLAVR